MEELNKIINMIESTHCYIVYDAYSAQLLQLLQRWAINPLGDGNIMQAWDDVDFYNNDQDDFSKPLSLRLGPYDGHHGEAQLFASRIEAERICELLKLKMLADGTSEEEIEFRVLEVYPKVELQFETELVLVDPKG